MKRLTSLLLCMLLMLTLAFPVLATEETGSVGDENTVTVPDQNTEETVEPTQSVSCTHKFDELQKVDESRHELMCSLCGESGQLSSHVWSDGDVIVPATCIQEGTRKLVCACGATGTKVEPKGKHTYDHDCDTSCNICSAQRTTTHSYDNACDPDCNACGEKRSTSHTYGSSWSRDHSGHWHECTKCGEKVDFRSHYPGPAATEDAPQLCLTCDYMIAQQKEHQHNYAKQWSQDETGHWYACATCQVKKDAGSHVYDSDCDTHCNTCNYENPEAHDYGNTWDGDEKHHWAVCKACGQKSEPELHIPGPEATEDQPQLCKVCAYELVPAQAHEHVFGPVWMYDGKSHWQGCVCGEQSVPSAHTWDDGTKNRDKTVTYLCTQCQAERTEKASGFPWWILVIFLLLAAGGGAAVYVYYVMPQQKGGKFAAK